MQSTNRKRRSENSRLLHKRKIRIRIKKRRKIRKNQSCMVILFKIIVIICIASLIGLIIFNTFHTSVKEETLNISGLIKNFNNIEIAYVTDIDYGDFFSQNRVNKLVNTINGLNVDIVLFGGDYTQNNEDTISFFNNLPDIQARLGVFGVLGDHERKNEAISLTSIVSAMNNAGVVPLVNSVSQIKLGQYYLYIAGLDDITYGSPNFYDITSQVTQDDFVIFLAHNPDALTDAISATSSDGNNHWFDLAFFGDTMGGQIQVLNNSLFPQLVPKLGKRYLSGWFTENRANILISNGVGTQYIPLRFLSQSQIHMITLKRN